MSEFRKLSALQVMWFALIGAVVGGLVSCHTPRTETRPVLPSNTPVIVHGGAMTFRSDLQFATDTASAMDCIPFSSGTQVLVSDQDIWGNNLAPSPPPPLPPGTQVDFFVRTTDGKGPSSSDEVRGFVESTCGNRLGISLKLVNGRFYSYKDGKNDDDQKTFIKRFRPDTCTSILTGDNNNGDRDMCDRIWGMFITLNPPNGEQTNQQTIQQQPLLPCPNGACVIVFTHN
jgi:hypothetical protein